MTKVLVWEIPAQQFICHMSNDLQQNPKETKTQNNKETTQVTGFLTLTFPYFYGLAFILMLDLRVPGGMEKFITQAGAPPNPLSSETCQLRGES